MSWRVTQQKYTLEHWIEEYFFAIPFWNFQFHFENQKQNIKILKGQINSLEQSYSFQSGGEKLLDKLTFEL